MYVCIPAYFIKCEPHTSNSLYINILTQSNDATAFSGQSGLTNLGATYCFSKFDV